MTAPSWNCLALFPSPWPGLSSTRTCIAAAAPDSRELSTQIPVHRSEQGPSGVPRGLQPWLSALAAQYNHLVVVGDGGLLNQPHSVP